MLTKADLEQIKQLLNKSVSKISRKVEHEGAHQESEFVELLERLERIEMKLDQLADLLGTKQHLEELLKPQEIRH